jgi:putative ABC transport system substrate-binding protein
MKNIHAAARTLAVTILPLEVRSIDEIERAFVTMAQQRPDAIIVVPDAVLNSHRERMAALAIQHRLALVGSSRFFAEAGALASYGQNYATHRRRATAYIDKILKGAKPAELPIEQPTTFELIINRRTAKAIGQAISHELMLRVDAVIE